MTALEERIPVDDLATRARAARISRIVVTVIAACFLAIGWAIGRFFRILGWVSGAVFRGCVFCGLAVAEGFELGAKLAPKPPEEQPRQP
jgi:hypothetical protein